jgi:hypothetical protein
MSAFLASPSGQNNVALEDGIESEGLRGNFHK